MPSRIFPPMASRWNAGRCNALAPKGSGPALIHALLTGRGWMSFRPAPDLVAGLQGQERPMQQTLHNPLDLPDDLPVPVDDGGARHLAGMALPDVTLAATDGARVNLPRLPGRTVVYIYPRAGRPGQALPTGWNGIPGARGCTPQSCSFRDHFDELRSLGVRQLYGLSTQDSDYQREAVERLHLPFAI